MHYLLVPGKGVFSLSVPVILTLMLVSCTTSRNSSSFPEDEFFLTRKYVGNFVEYSSSSPYYHGGPHIITITTTQDSLYGKISAYSRDCNFAAGDRLYIRRVYKTRGTFGNWKYQIENDRKKRIVYQISGFTFNGKRLEQSWF